MFAKLKPFVSCIFLLPTVILSLNANAAFIDFDDIVAPPASPFDCDTVEPCGLILSDEYKSQGAIFGSDSWLVGTVLPDGTNQNQVLGTNGIGILFVGTLPNFISFNIDSPYRDEASYISVYGENNELLFVHESSGWNGWPETSTPYIPGELVSINAIVGIKIIYIESFYGLRVGPTIDNLTFEFRSVPEPAPLALLLTGLAGVFWSRKNNT